MEMEVDGEREVDGEMDVEMGVERDGDWEDRI